MLNLYDLEPGVIYAVIRPFADYHRQQFEVGQKLTYVERHFLPYHGGHTLVFRERNLYLQEDENADIISSLSDYLAPYDLNRTD